MENYKKECGLTKEEHELEKLVDAIRSEPSTLICIKILERGFKKLNTPRVSVNEVAVCPRCRNGYTLPITGGERRCVKCKGTGMAN